MADAKKPWKVFVGFSTEPVDNIEELMPEFEAPSNIKDPVKIAAAIEEKRAKFLAGAARRCYTGRFKRIAYLLPMDQTKILGFNAEPGKLSPAQRMKNLLLRKFPDAWVPRENESDEDFRRRPADVQFVGFDVKLFLDMLGIDCSVPAYGGEPSPLPLWYGNSDHRDIGSAVSRECGDLDLLTIVKKFRRPVVESEAKLFDAQVDEWQGPGIDPDRDVRVATILAEQIRLISNRDVRMLEENKPVREGLTRSDTVDPFGRVPKFRLPFGQAKRLVELEADYAFFTPAILYLCAGFTDAPLADYLAGPGKGEKLYYCQFGRPLFRGLDSSTGDPGWNFALWAVHRPAWPGFSNFMVSLSFTYAASKTVGGVGEQDLDIFDPLAIDTGSLLNGGLPVMRVGVFGFNGSRYRAGLVPPADPRTGIPTLKFFAGDPKMQRFAAALYRGDSNPLLPETPP